ncbi:MAG: hypothetical protein II601_07185, partial [Lachnospiraceae bacterium]|nr:hypothetical protein [Lachnospiraceae bacterium]
MKHRTLRSNLILLAVLLLALSALLMSACGNDHSSATLDGTTEASQEAPTDAAETTEAPSDTAPPTEVEPSTPTETEPSSPTETDPAPSKENEEPTTYAPRDPEEVEIVTLNPEGLSAEKLAVLQRYLTDLAVVQDASALDYVADEIKAAAGGILKMTSVETFYAKMVCRFSTNKRVSIWRKLVSLLKNDFTLVNALNRLQMTESRGGIKPNEPFAICLREWERNLERGYS